MKTIKYPKIRQFRDVIISINRQVTFTGLDENGNAMYDNSIPKPTIKFKGTVKLHGSNAGISYNAQDGIYTQSRNNSFDLEKNADSHMGFTFFVKSRLEKFQEFFDKLVADNNIDINENTVTIYGEWAGKGIQKGVSISNIEKSLFIFGVKVSKPNDPDFTSYWIDHTGLHAYDLYIYNIEDFQTWEVEVDFSMPKLASEKFIKITEEVEKECPVAKEFGYSGIGEGVVWSATYKGETHRFKVKGEKHSVSKVKTIAPVDIEKLNSIKEFVDYSVTKNRFDQGIQEVFGSEENMDIKKLGDFLRWIINDIASEETETMAGNGLEPKDVNKHLSTRAREMFFTKYNSFAG